MAKDQRKNTLSGALKWRRTLLEMESKQCMKELQHLKMKEMERGLTDWERERIAYLPVELALVHSKMLSPPEND